MQHPVAERNSLQSRTATRPVHHRGDEYRISRHLVHTWASVLLSFALKYRKNFSRNLSSSMNWLQTRGLGEGRRRRGTRGAAAAAGPHSALATRSTTPGDRLRPRSPNPVMRRDSSAEARSTTPCADTDDIFTFTRRMVSAGRPPAPPDPAAPPPALCSHPATALQ